MRPNECFYSETAGVDALIIARVYGTTNSERGSSLSPQRWLLFLGEVGGAQRPVPHCGPNQLMCGLPKTTNLLLSGSKMSSSEERTARWLGLSARRQPHARSDLGPPRASPTASGRLPWGPNIDFAQQRRLAGLGIGRRCASGWHRRRFCGVKHLDGMQVKA